MSLPSPEPNLRATIVVPAKDEEDLVGRCVCSLASQTGVEPEEYEILLVLDNCNDETGDRALEAASDYPGLRLFPLEGPGLGAGHARRVGMEMACERLLSLERPGALIASTDADTVVAPDWLCRQLAAASEGARAVGGRIELLKEDGLSEEIRSWRDRRGETRHLELLEQSAGKSSGSRVEHWQFSGASMSLTAEAYREVGGMEPRAVLEDEYLERALERCNIPIERPLDVRVSTSPRLIGRASRGLARDLYLASWLRDNTYPALQGPPATSVKITASVIAPAIEPESRHESAPETPEVPGVELELIQLPKQDSDTLPLAEFGPILGRGDALWRGLSGATGDLVVLLPDSSPESLAAVPALLSPLLERDKLEMVKGFPPDGEGSELSRLVGAPLINLHHPELAGFMDPLSSFVATRRPLLQSLHFPVGPGVDASLLLDAVRSRGVCKIAQAALPSRCASPPGSTEDSYAIMAAFLSRVSEDTEISPSPAPLSMPSSDGDGFDTRRIQIEERPPLEKVIAQRVDSRAFDRIGS